jgi:hypothetical protein
LGSIATLMTGSGKVIVSRRIGLSGAASVSPVTTCLIPDGRGDVARPDLVDVLAVVGVHHQDAPDALRLAELTLRIGSRPLEVARVDAEER